MRNEKKHRDRPAKNYLGDGVLARPVDDVVQRPLPAHVVHADELEETSVDEAHAHAVPDVHGREVRDNWQRRPEAVRRCEKIEHCRHT